MYLPKETLSASDVIAATSRENSAQANRALFQALEGKELFFAVELKQTGDSNHEESRDSISAYPLLVLPSGQKAFRVFGDQNDTHLRRPFGGALWQDIPKMLLAMPEADGLLLVGAQGSVVAMDRAAVFRILEEQTRLPPQAPERPRSRH